MRTGPHRTWPLPSFERATAAVRGATDTAQHLCRPGMLSDSGCALASKSRAVSPRSTLSQLWQLVLMGRSSLRSGSGESCAATRSRHRRSIVGAVLSDAAITCLIWHLGRPEPCAFLAHCAVRDPWPSPIGDARAGL